MLGASGAALSEEATVHPKTRRQARESSLLRADPAHQASPHAGPVSPGLLRGWSQNPGQGKGSL